MGKKLLSMLQALLFLMLVTLPASLSAQDVSKLTRAQVEEWAKTAPNGGHLPQYVLQRMHAPRAKKSVVAESQTLPKQPTHKVAAKPLVATTTGTGREIWGNLIYSEEWYETGNSRLGYYSFNSTPNTDISTIAIDDAMDASYGGIICDGVFHAVYVRQLYGYDIACYSEYNISNWSAVKTDVMLQDYKLLASTTAYDPVTKKVYGNFYLTDTNTQEFGYADYENYTHVRLGDAKSSMVAMACTADGTLYGIDTNGTLYTINKTDGTCTEVGSTGVDPNNYFQSAVADDEAGCIYWTASHEDGTTALYQVDPTTAAASLVLDFEYDRQFVGLYLPEQSNQGLPQRPTNFNVDFPNGSTTGTVSFTMPSYTMAGDQIVDDLTYTLSASGYTRTGTAAPGETVSLTLTLQEGAYDFSVTATNSEGTSNSVSLSQWIGQDTPGQVSDLTFTLDEATNKATLTWSAPEVGANGGYIDTSSLRYDIIRYPNTVMVSSYQKGTSFSETLPADQLAKYYYQVCAYSNNRQGEWATSNTIMAGNPLEVPYSEDFSGNGFQQYTVVDANNDGVTWYETNVQNVMYMRSASHSADDWLITPPIKLDPDHVYEFAAKISGNSVNDERYAVAFGQGEDPETYTPIVEPTDISHRDYVVNLKKDVRVDEAGGYRFAIHLLSDAGRYTATVDDIAVTVSSNGTAPDSVTNLKATPAARGALGAEVTFNAPTKTIMGETLSSISKIELYHGDELATTFENPAPGESLSYTFSNLEAGENTFSARAWNAEGQGAKTETSAFIGPDAPDIPLNVTLTDNFDGTATLTWQSPGEVGQNGGYVDQSALTYTVYSISGGVVSPLQQGVTGNSYSVSDVPTSGEQTSVVYALRAINSQGRSDITASNTILAGDPYELPFKESFAGGYATYYWSVTATGSLRFGLTQSVTYDDDEGAAAFQAALAGDQSNITCGNISFRRASNPTLTFAYWAEPGVDAQLTVNAWRNGSNRNILELATIDFRTLTGEAGWRTQTIDLSALKSDHCDRISFVATTYDPNVPIIFDAVSITDPMPYNLIASMQDVPASVEAGKDITASVLVTNMGENPASSYTVTLYAGGKTIGTTQGAELQPGEAGLFPFTWTTSLADPDKLQIWAVVNYDKDQNRADNTTSVSYVTVTKPIYPTVTDLALRETGKWVVLSWSKPDTEAGTVVEDFESYEPFTITDFGDWTMVDKDGGTIYGFSNGINIKNTDGPAAYMVFNPDSVANISVFGDGPAHSGSQYLACFYADPAPNDDWLISPELKGYAQTISLWARVWSTAFAYGTETFEILYSTGSTDTDDFVTAGSYKVNSETWKEFTASIPEGAKRFAVRCTSNDAFMLMIDDIIYRGGSYTVAGYNVYRNGELIATVGADETSYVDSGLDAGTSYDYNVTTVYTVGESAFSNTASLLTTSVSEATAKAVKVESLRGGIAVSGAQGETVTVFAANGTQAFSALSTTDRLVISLPAGTYVVKAAGTTVKAIAR